MSYIVALIIFGGEYGWEWVMKYWNSDLYDAVSNANTLCECYKDDEDIAIAIIEVKDGEKIKLPDDCIDFERKEHTPFVWCITEDLKRLERFSYDYVKKELRGE